MTISKLERDALNSIVSRIREECSEKIDTYSQDLIVSNLETLLNYSLRFYGRQFIARKANHHSIVVKFANILNTDFEDKLRCGKESLSVHYFADKLNISPSYLSSLIKKETGYSVKEHISNFIIKKAKNKLLGTDHTVSEIAYSLGFNYPHYFSRFFSSKVGMTPTEYKNVN